MAPEETDDYTPLVSFTDEPLATLLPGRMLVIKYDQQHRDRVTQGYIERIWTRSDEPDVLHIKLSSMMRLYNNLDDARMSVWRYEEDDARTLHLRDEGARSTSVLFDPTGLIIIRLMNQGYIIQIPSPDTKHPQPEEILPPTGAIPFSNDFHSSK